MQPSVLQSNDEQQNNTTTSATNATDRIVPTPTAPVTTSTTLSTPPRIQPASSSLPMHQNISSFPSQFDRERSTLRLADLEPWMGGQYAQRLAEVMEWPPVHVRFPSPPPPATTSPNDSLDNDTPHPTARRHPGHVFITFRSAADAASVLAQLHVTNATQSRAGRPPVRLLDSERIVDLTYASREDSLKCWDYHFHGTSHDSQAAPSNTPGRIETNPMLDESTPLSSHTPKRASTPSVSPRPASASAAPGSKLSTTPANSSDSGISSQLTNPPPPQRGTGEYSIFVGDLAPDVTHADITAVFRDPTKGLRPDRGPPRKIKPFASCKTAKIMVDPSTGLSRGYGFIRFTDEADQRRALIEMQGLYCLSRPMRLSHATAKGKGVAASSTSGDGGSSLDRTDQEFARSLPSSSPGLEAAFQTSFPAAAVSQHRHVSSPSTLAVYGDSGGNVKRNSVVSLANPTSHPSRPQSAAPDAVSVPSDRINPSTLSSEARALTIQDIPPSLVVQIAALARNGTLLEYLLQNDCTDAAEALSRSSLALSNPSIEKTKAREKNPAPPQGLQARSTPSNDGAGTATNVRPSVPLDESKLDEGTRDLLSSLTENMAGSSSDPYNTTVFVGGLSSLIPEDTLRSYFAPFGDIHYVKIPPGKGCGFVQFVHKADATRAMEHMQGFAIGGSKIRLSWGRSQYRAAVAAAQATQLGINMGELQNLADANGGAFPPLFDRTPSPRASVACPLQEPNRDFPPLKEERSGSFSIPTGPSSSAPLRHSEVVGREGDFTNYTRRPVQVSPTAASYFAPFSPDLGPRRISSPSTYGSVSVEGVGAREGSFATHLRESRPFDLGMGDLPAPRMGLEDTLHRHPELSLDEFHHAQPHEPRGSVQLSQVPGLTALQLQQHNVPRFDRSSPFGSSLEESTYSTHELIPDDFVVRGGVYGGAPMNRVPTYRRDYGSPPTSGWHGR